MVDMIPPQRIPGLIDATEVIPKRINVASTTLSVYIAAAGIILSPIFHRRLPNIGDALAFAGVIPLAVALWYCLTRPWIRRFDESEVRLQKPPQLAWLGCGGGTIFAGIGLLLLFGPLGFVGSPGQMALGWLFVALGALAGFFISQPLTFVLVARDRRYSYTTSGFPLPAVRTGNFDDIESVTVIKHRAGGASCIAVDFKFGGKTKYFPISDNWTDTQTIGSAFAGVVGVQVYIDEEPARRRS